MKKIIKIFTLILSLIFLSSIAGFGCGELSEKDKALLNERREIVVDYMRKQTSVIWRAGETFTYSVYHTGKDNDVVIKEGELYLGVPYTYAGGTLDAFLEYSTNGVDGIPVLNGLSSGVLNGGMAEARVGNDCSSAVYLAWSQVSTSITPAKDTASMKYMNKNNGFLPLGNYVCDDNNDMTTNKMVSESGEKVIYESYALLQKGDVVYHRNSSAGHALMVTEINVVYDKFGEIDPYQSSVVVLEQTFGNLKTNAYYFDEELNEKVNIICGVDVSYSFSMLYNDRYVPITCKELIEPTKEVKVKVNDSVKKPSIENLFEGTITSNYFMDSIYIDILDGSAKLVQECVGRMPRFSQYSYDLSRFVNDDKAGFLGEINLDKLQKGTYICQVKVKLTKGNVLTVRDFNFTI